MEASRYTATERLSGGDRTVLYRGIRTRDQQPVLIKGFGREPDARELAWLRNEYAVGAGLRTDVAVHPLAFGTHLGMPALILEDFDGEPLDRLMGAPMELTRALQIAVRVAAALAEIHREHVVHKGIKPESILLRHGTAEVKLTDFGIASLVPREHLPSRSASTLEASLPYMSPEQTGRMNRALDYRTDLYSLGVVLYEMLTGRRPFEADDALEWVHCHIARIPPPPSALVPDLPEMVDRIVMKLLAKLAEDRYQSAAGLQHDLARCLDAWEAGRRIDPFPLGQRDLSEIFAIPQRLYGREKEIGILLGAFERVVETGAPAVMLISGYSGIGKSTLVHELQKPIVRERGFFVSGKFDQYKRNVPYATIGEAFHDLLLEVLGESEDQLAVWRRRLRSAVGINGQLIVDLIPAVELVIGKQPPVAELSPAEAQNRFQMVFLQFLGVFAREEHPLVLFLDDLQWIDLASLGLLRHVVPHVETRHLLLIGAYRDNEVGPSHPLLLAIDELRRDGATVDEIVLGPLSPTCTAALVADALHAGAKDVVTLASLVHEKTSGNPFFVRHFLTTLHDEGLIELDVDASAWRWDVERIRAKAFTDNVVDLMVAKLRRLAPATQEVLKLAACVGSTTDHHTLAIVGGHPEAEVDDDLGEAVREGLLARLDGSYRFVHDRVQEAAYALIPGERRPAVHVQIGRLLLSELASGALDQRVFDVVDQLNRGIEQITDPGERATLARLDFLAGMKAKAAVAYGPASSYLALAIALLPWDAWRTRYDETFQIYLACSECEYLTGRFERADELFDLILANARSVLDRARVYSLRMKLLQVSGHYDKGVTVALEALRLFGVTFPDSDEELARATQAAAARIHINLRGRRPADLLDAEVVSDPVVRAIIGLLVDAEPCAYIGRPRIFPLLALEAVNLSLQHGNIEDSCFAYSVYGFMLVSVFQDIPSGFEFSEMSLRLNEKFDDRRLRGTLLHLHADHIQFWRRPFAVGLPLLRRAFVACLEVGDLVYAGFLAFETVWQVLEKGEPLDEVLRVSRRYAAFALEHRNRPVLETIRTEQQFVACLRGLTRAPPAFDDAGYDQAASLAAVTEATFGCGIVFHHIMNQIARFLHGQHAAALASALEAKQTLGAAMAMPIEATHHFFHALTLTALYPTASAERRRELAATLDEILPRLALWAKHCPENFAGRHALVSAEVAAIEGRALEAMRLYDEAIRSAGENGFVYLEAIASELAAQYYRRRELRRVADAYLSDAHAAYARWGAEGKVRQLESQYPELARTTSPATARVVASAEQLDLRSVVKASQTISGEMVLERLVSTLMRILLEQGGAQRGCLVLLREHELSIVVEAEVGAEGISVALLPAEPVSSRRVPARIVYNVWRTKRRLILDDPAEATTFARDEYIVRQRPRSVLCLPIVRQTKPIGVLYLEHNVVAGAFTPDRLAVLELLASQAAISLENARLLAGEQAARSEAEQAARRAAIFAEVGKVLMASLDWEPLMVRLADLCVRFIADWCVVDVVEDHQLRRVAIAHADPARRPLLAELQERYPPTWESRHVATVAMRTGQSVLLPEVTDAVIQQFVTDQAHAELVTALGIRTALVVPIVSRGQPIGTLTLCSSSPDHRYDDADRELVEELARRAAIAIDNARLYRRTQAAVQLRDDFISIASHELRTPMASLMLSLQGLSSAGGDRPLDDTKRARLLELAVRQGRRLGRLINELLDVTRIGTGRMVLEPRPTDLAAVVRELVTRFEVDLKAARSELTVLAAAPVVGAWDQSRLEQVVSNLIANAIKFGAGKPIEVRVGQTGDRARLVVRDQGIGIALASQHAIFDRFERAVSAEHYGGLGLGLYICREIVRAHGGTIEVESSPGQGSTFTVELPVAGPPPPPDAEPS